VNMEGGFMCKREGLRLRRGEGGKRKEERRRRTYSRNKDKQRLENLNVLGEQVQTKVDKDEILG